MIWLQPIVSFMPIDSLAVSNPIDSQLSAFCQEGNHFEPKLCRHSPIGTKLHGRCWRVSLSVLVQYPPVIADNCSDYFGLNGDPFTAVPKNVSSVVDLLEDKGISEYACFILDIE